MKHIYTLVALLTMAAQPLNAQLHDLWATAATGGAYGFGTILRGNGDGTNFHAVASFDSLNGSYPLGSMAMAANGKLYGVTELGCFEDSCCIFSYDTTTQELVAVYQFFDSIQLGGLPAGGLVQAPGGKLYGTALSGGAFYGGVIYSFDPATNTYTDVWDFDTASASIPVSALILANDGKLYGTGSMSGGGCQPFLFSFDPAADSFQVLSVYHPDYAPSPYTGLPSLAGATVLQASDNKLYGVFVNQGINYVANPCTLFSYDIPSRVTRVLYSFDSLDRMLLSNMVQASNGLIYGATNQELFSYDIQSDSFRVLSYWSNDSIGSGPGGISEAPGGTHQLIISMFSGGLYGYGTLATYDYINNKFNVLFDFDGTTGSSPTCIVLSTDAAKPAGIQGPGGSDNTAMSIYPNPVSAILHVESALPDAPYVITDISGREVLKGIFKAEQASIDVSKLSAGMYFINRMKLVLE